MYIHTCIKRNMSTRTCIQPFKICKSAPLSDTHTQCHPAIVAQQTQAKGCHNKMLSHAANCFK